MSERRSLAVVGIVVFVSMPASAQQGANIDIQQFRPAMDSKGYITVNAAQVLGHLDLSLGFVTSWGWRPFKLESGTSVYRIDNLVTPQLQAAIGLFRYGEFGVGLPLTVVSGAANGANVGENKALGWQGVGDLKLHLKGAVLPLWRYPVGLAALLTVSLPTASSGAWMGDGHTTVLPGLIAETVFGPGRRWRAALNVGGRIRTASGSFTDGDSAGRIGTHQSLSVGKELTYGAALSYTIVHQRVELVGEAFGSVGKRRDQEFGRTAPAEAALAVKVYLAHNSFFMVGAGGGLNPNGYGTPLVRAFGAFIFEPRVADRDGDGVPDTVDLCPDEPGPRENLGCPDEDRDHDGLVYRLDRCPDDPGPKETGGCPIHDQDGDGIPDKLDKCPTVAGLKKFDGCPDPKGATVGWSTIEILDKIYFETNKAIIKPVSYPILNSVVIALQEHTQLLKVEVQGHADERGSHAHNDWLTTERARAVLEYLVQHGVERGRLESHGYGKRRPLPECLANNETCWSQNRRVEFVILSRSDRRD